MNLIQIVLLALGGLVLLAGLLAAGVLLYIQRRPTVIAKRMRGDGSGDAGVLSYPPNYGQYERDVEVLADLEYPSAAPANGFDLYLPKQGGAPARLPLVVWVHGGGFIAGDKRGVKNLCTMLAAEGYAVLAPNYAVAPEYPYPTAVVQVNGLLAHLPALAAAHPQMDLGRVFLAGDSAGAQIAAQAAAVETNPALAAQMKLAPRLAPGALRGTLLCCGPYDMPALRRVPGLKMKYVISVWGRAYYGTPRWHKSRAAAETQLEKQVTEGFPPTYLTDGNSFSFEAQARRLGEALRQRGVFVAERYFDPAQYGQVNHEYQFLLAEDNALLAYRDMVDFLARWSAEPQGQTEHRRKAPGGTEGHAAADSHAATGAGGPSAGVAAP